MIRKAGWLFTALIIVTACVPIMVASAAQAANTGNDALLADQAGGSTLAMAQAEQSATQFQISGENEGMVDARRRSANPFESWTTNSAQQGTCFNLAQAQTVNGITAKMTTSDGMCFDANTQGTFSNTSVTTWCATAERTSTGPAENTKIIDVAGHCTHK